MLALVRDGGNDPPVALAEVTDAQADAGEALVEVRASSVNRGELRLLEGRPDGWRPGQDIAGVVTQSAADRDGPPAGTRVAGLVVGGGWSKRVAVPPARLAELPDGVSFEDAATVGIAGLTALRTVRLCGPLLGSRLLVIGATGAVGRLAVQLGVQAGAVVTAQARTRERSAELEQLGAERLVTPDELEEAAYDAALDGVGGPMLEQAIRCLRPGGTVVVYGAMTREPARIGLGDFAGHEGARIVSFMSYAYGREEDIGPDLAVLVDLIARGRLNTSVAATEDWRDAGRLIAALRAGEISGKAVLTVGAGRGAA